MTQEESKAIGCSTIEEMIAEDFGEIGTPERAEFELGFEAFVIGERLKAERLSQGISTYEHNFTRSARGCFMFFFYRYIM